MKKLKNVTIRDVAKLAKVSPTTVSMILNNNKQSFSKEVKIRVLQATKELKYHPTGVGRPSVVSARKKLKSSHKIKRIILLLDESHMTLSNSIYSQVKRGVELELLRQNIDLIIQNTQSLALPVESSGVITIGELDGLKKAFIADKPFIVCMNLFMRHSKFDHITYSNRDIPLLAAQYFIEQKHESISAINLRTTEFDNSRILIERYELFKQAVQSFGKTFYSFSPAIRLGDWRNTPHKLDFILKKYFCGHDHPTALFVPSDKITSIIYPLFYSVGIIPGRDIEIVTCNNEFFSLAGLTPSPTVIDIKAFEIGRFAALQLIERIKHPNTPHVKIQLMPELIKGKNWHKSIRKNQ